MNGSNARNVDLALGHRGDQDVQCLFGDAVEFFKVEQRPGTHRAEERTVDERVVGVAAFEHEGRIMCAEEPCRGQLGVAFDEDEISVELVGDSAEQG